MAEKRGGTAKIIVAAVLTVLIAALGAGVYLFVGNTRLESVTVEGNSRYSDEELLKLIFPTEKDRRTAKVWLDEYRGEHREIPFVSRYEITLTGLHTAEIMVYEKNIVACLDYMGSIMYFDKDGIVVETGDTNTEGVPVITGIVFSQIVMHQPIVTENREIFSAVLHLTQLLSLYELDVERVYYHDNLEARLYMGGLRVELGGSQYMDEKILELKSMLPQLEGQSGTLYLNSYHPDAVKPHYRFKPDITAEE